MNCLPFNLMKKNPLNMAVGAVLIIICGLLMFQFQVRTSEVAVVTTFGKPTERQYTNAAYFKAPWPIQKVTSSTSASKISRASSTKRSHRMAII